MRVPELRFRAEDGTEYPEWEEMMLGDVFTEIVDKNHPELPVLSILQGTGTVLRDSLDRRIMYDKQNLAGYKAMKKGDFIIHLRSFEGGLECANQDGISSPAYHILRSTRLNDVVYRVYFRSSRFISGKLAMAVVGIRDGKSIDMESFWQITIPVPSLPEQRQIAAFLSALDEVIAASEKEVAALERQKKGAMQRIFSREVRFKDEDGTEYPEWEQKLLGQLYRQVVEKNDGTFGADKIISVANMYFKTDVELGSVEYLKTYNVCRLGDIAFEGHQNKDHAYGRFVMNDVGDGIVSHIFVVLRPVEVDCCDFYWKYAINYEPIMGKVLVKCTKKSTMMNDLVAKDFLKQKILVPSLPEQHKIAAFLSDFDAAIIASKRELELYKRLKRGLMQRMFI